MGSRLWTWQSSNSQAELAAVQKRLTSVLQFPRSSIPRTVHVQLHHKKHTHALRIVSTLTGVSKELFVNDAGLREDFLKVLNRLTGSTAIMEWTQIENVKSQNIMYTKITARCLALSESNIAKYKLLKQRVGHLAQVVQQFLVEKTRQDKNTITVDIKLGEDFVLIEDAKVKETIPPEIIYKVRFSECPDKVFLIFGDGKVLEAGKHLSALMSYLKIGQIRLSWVYEGHSYKSGDFVVFLGKIKANNSNDLQRVFAEVTYEGCPEERSSDSLLTEFFQHICLTNEARASAKNDLPTEDTAEAGFRRLALAFADKEALGGQKKPTTRSSSTTGS